MSEFIAEVDAATSALRAHTDQCISVAAGCDLFTRFVTRTANESTEDFATFRQKLVEKIHCFGERSLQCREKIAELAIDFIRDDATIMIHSYSRVVMLLLLRAAAMNRRFSVMVTEARPTSGGHRAVEALKRAGIPAAVILDAAVGFYIQKVDMVLVGAEGVVENGGIINQVGRVSSSSGLRLLIRMEQIGTYLMAVMAKAADIPFYAVAENYKFVRSFPLTQYDLPAMSSAMLYSGEPSNQDRVFQEGHPTIDYTPPSYITLLFTDVGVLTPSAVSDELIKLYF